MTTLFERRGEEQEVGWQPLSRALLEKADKRIFLFIGESGAHAAAALDTECFDESAVASELRERFIPVRVDADREPHIAQRCLAVAGKLPNSGASLLCASDRAASGLALLGDPSPAQFVTQLRALASAELTSRPWIELEAPREDGDASSLADACAESARRVYDTGAPGFGQPPRPIFAPLLELLLKRGNGDAALARAVLMAMAAGGIRDHLMGGFHRDSLDEKWIVPHFEKRVDVQAALLPLYAQLDGDVAAQVVVELIEFLETRLRLSAGYAASEAADIGNYDDGAHYTFSLDEARALLSREELEAVQPHYDIYGRGELSHSPTRNVLFVAAQVEGVAKELRLPREEIARRIGRAKAKLQQARRDRPQPPLDETIYTAVQAHVARAYLESPRLLASQPELARRAFAALEQLYSLGNAPGGGMLHSPVARDGVLDLADQAAVGCAALAAHRVGGAPHHRMVAEELAAIIRERFVSDGGLTDTQAGVAPGRFGAKRWPMLDGALPSATALALRMFRELGEHDFARSFASRMTGHARSLGIFAAGFAAAAL